MMKEELVVRPATGADHREWQKLWKGYQNFYGVNLDDTTDDTWRRIISPEKNGPFCLVAEAPGGALAGFTQYIFHIHTWTPGSRCYLVDLYTDPAFRRKGIAEKLIHSVYEKADEAGCSQTYWLTQSNNTIGRKLYDKVAKETSFMKYQR